MIKSNSMTFPIYNTHAGDKSDGLLWGIEASNVFIVIGGLAVSVFFAYLSHSSNQEEGIITLTGCFVPLIITLLYVFTLRQGKPKSFDVDLVDTFVNGPAWGIDFKKAQVPNPCTTPTRDHQNNIDNQAPNGWLAEGLIVYNRIGIGGFVAKGYKIQVPDLRQGSESAILQLHDAIRRFLHTLDENTRCQIQWSVDSNYRTELLKYDEVTQQCSNEWSKRVREAIFTRLWDRMNNNQLRKEQLVIFLAKPITTNAPLTLSVEQETEHYRSALKTMSEALDHQYSVMASILSSAGCSIQPMDDEAHARHYARFLNPSYTTRSDFDPLGLFNPEETIQENFWHGGCQGGKEFGFFNDGYYHNIVVLKRRPQRTTSGMVFSLTNLPFLDYSITVNLYPKSVQKELTKEESTLMRVSSSYNASKKQKLLTAIEIKQSKIRGLSQGDVYPIDYDYVVHVWADSKDSLISKTRQIEAAINSMADAQSWTTNISSAATTKKMWYQTWPGNLWGKYTPHRDDGLDYWLTPMLPFSSSFVGYLEHAEALFDGPNGTLVGYTTFLSNTPQLCAVLGMTRAGKSAWTINLLTQTEPYYDFTLIIEEGLSYGTYTKTLGSEPIIVQPDGEMCLNYFDTHSTPLTLTQIHAAAAILLKMAGVPHDEDKRNLRFATLMHYVEEAYLECYNQYILQHPESANRFTREALAIEKFKKEKLSVTATFLDAWSEYKEYQQQQDEEQTFLEDEITNFIKDPLKAELIRAVAFSYFKPEEFPTHIDLVEIMSTNRLRSHNQEEVNMLITLLRPWEKQKLVSGTSTISIKGKVAHFELALLSQDSSLKEVTGFLIANYGRQHIISLPRGSRKRVVFEEVARLLDIPGGEKLVAEFYQQLSKYSTWIVSIVQQYSSFKNSSIRPIVIGNAKQVVITAMNDRSDLEDVAMAINLPNATKESIHRYTLPEHMPVEKKYASFTYWHLDAREPRCGTMYNVATPEMLYCSDSTGSNFDKRAKALRIYDNVVEGIINESQNESKPM